MVSLKVARYGDDNIITIENEILQLCISIKMYYKFFIIHLIVKQRKLKRSE